MKVREEFRKDQLDVDLNDINRWVDAEQKYNKSIEDAMRGENGTI